MMFPWPPPHHDIFHLVKGGQRIAIFCIELYVFQLGAVIRLWWAAPRFLVHPK
jgi:hypothetical protein